VEVENNTATIVGAGVDTYGTTEMPADLIVAMALRISGRPEEFGEPFSLSAKVVGPRLDTLFEDEFPFTLGVPTVLDERLDASFVTPIAVAFEVQAAGVHTITFAVNPNERYETDIMVKAPGT
jgi:hypothetical protein